MKIPKVFNISLKFYVMLLWHYDWHKFERWWLILWSSASLTSCLNFLVFTNVYLLVGYNGSTHLFVTLLWGSGKFVFTFLKYFIFMIRSHKRHHGLLSSCVIASLAGYQINYIPTIIRLLLKHIFIDIEKRNYINSKSQASQRIS